MNDDADAFLDPQALARAEAALARLGQDYPHWVEADLARARACLGPPADPDRLYRLAHDIKGQAGTFDYPLVSTIAARLCAALQAATPEPERVLRHLDAMAEVIARRLRGDGGEAGRQLLSRLD